MNSRERSLRALVDKWLGSDDEHVACITRLSRGARGPWRHVCVEAQRASGPFAIVFFRHDDGSWCVYPPPIRRPAMAIAWPVPRVAAEPVAA
ncbi:hypothetical protein IAG25_31090 [Caballeronia sp. EK]|uniref:hypothetical protein n=1 Tax=Caballeronia sp. EK TaxID=2767469 RepID=UPI0016563E28|nr:hypothetical protein [Caballeronia sp. EK]MBC8641269.1 hypothetical protein [Caballeronia sp. EK]